MPKAVGDAIVDYNVDVFTSLDCYIRIVHFLFSLSLSLSLSRNGGYVPVRVSRVLQDVLYVVYCTVSSLYALLLGRFLRRRKTPRPPPRRRAPGRADRAAVSAVQSVKVALVGKVYKPASIVHLDAICRFQRTDQAGFRCATKITFSRE